MTAADIIFINLSTASPPVADDAALFLRPMVEGLMAFRPDGSARREQVTSTPFEPAASDNRRHDTACLAEPCETVNRHNE
jgi:hypothetical protein